MAHPRHPPIEVTPPGSKNNDDIENALSEIMANDPMSPSIFSVERIRQQHFKHLILKFCKDSSPMVIIAAVWATAKLTGFRLWCRFNSGSGRRWIGTTALCCVLRLQRNSRSVQISTIFWLRTVA